MKNNGIVSNTLILTIGGFLAKVFSAVYRIFLTRILGGVGIGLYQLVFPFYSLCVVLATAGVPMAVSKIVSKNKGNENAILKKCLFYMLLLSLIVTFIVLVFCKPLSSAQGNNDLTWCYLVLAPSIMLVSFSSVLKGYFQGRHQFYPSAVSNIMEQVFKLIFGLMISAALIKISVYASVLGAMISVVASEVVSLLILIVFLKRKKGTEIKTANFFVKDLIKEVFPIMVTNLILPMATFIDSILVVNLLRLNFSNSVAVFLYGLESGAVSSLISLPTIFSFAIASVIMPNIASKFTKLKNEKLVLCIKFILIISLPCCLTFLLIPKKIISVLYSTSINGLGLSGVVIASRLLAISAIGVVFLSVNQLLSVSLQAVDKSGITIRNLLVSVMIKFLLIILFLRSGNLNIYVLAVANTFCYLLNFLLNFLEAKQTFMLNLDKLFFVKLMIYNIIFILILLIFYKINGLIGTILVGTTAILVYLTCVYIFGFLNKKEKAMFKYNK